MSKNAPELTGVKKCTGVDGPSTPVHFLFRTQLLEKILMLICASAADQSRIMQDQMTGPAMGMPPDPSKAFKVLLRLCLAMYFIVDFTNANF